MSQNNINHAEDQVASPMEDFEQFAEMHPSFIAECRRSLVRMKVEDLPRVILLSSSFPPVLEKISLKLVVERYEAEIKFLNSQVKSYQFKDPRAFLEGLPPAIKEEIPLPFEVQKEGDQAFKSHSEDAVEEAVIRAAQDADSLPNMEGQKKESVYNLFFDPVEEYKEDRISSNSPTSIHNESSGSENEGDTLSQESLLLNPMEEEEILVEACSPNIPSQVSFYDPYAHFLQTFEEGSKVFLGGMLQIAARNKKMFGNGKTKTKCESIAGGKLQNKIWKHRRAQLNNNATNGHQQSRVWDPGGQDSLMYYIVH